jgi:hypothetical protein
LISKLQAMGWIGFARVGRTLLSDAVDLAPGVDLRSIQPWL